MSQSTNLFTKIRFYDKTYNDKSQVENDLSLQEKVIENIKSQLHDLVMMTQPSKFFDKEKGSIRGQIDNEFNKLIEELEEAQIELWKLQILFDRWEACHNASGYAIPLMKPNGINDYGETIWTGVELNQYDTKEFYYNSLAFLDGDYIDTIYKNTKERI